MICCKTLLFLSSSVNQGNNYHLNDMIEETSVSFCLITLYFINISNSSSHCSIFYTDYLDMSGIENKEYCKHFPVIDLFSQRYN